MRPDFILGLDLAQASDWTALCLLERRQMPAEREATYDCSHLERWRGESYTGVPPRVQIVVDVLHAQYLERRRRSTLRLPERPAITLVVDRTGVGAAVVDFLVSAGLEPIGVTITGGDLVTQAGRDDYRTPKRDLAAIVAILLQQRRLRIAAALPLAGTLRHELENFKVTLSASGHDRYGAGADALSWREQPHDDLVLAVALAAWYAEYEARAAEKRTVYVGSYLGSDDDDDDAGPGPEWWSR
jgi:hypothetical protein